MRKLKFLGVTALMASLSAPVFAQMDVEEQIETRQSAYTFAAWNMGKIKAQAIDGDVAYDEKQILAAANAIAAVANSGMGSLYGPGTAMDKNDDTRLKPIFFEQPEKVREIAIGFIQAANKLQEVAAKGGDKAELVARFSDVGKSCKSCHDAFRAK